MNAKQKKAAALIVEGDLTQKQIAKELKVTVQTIINWRKKPEFKDLIIEYERENLKALTPKAIKTMNALLDARSELVRFKAASDILDRTGHKPIEEQEIAIAGVNITVGEYDEED